MSRDPVDKRAGVKGLSGGPWRRTGWGLGMPDEGSVQPIKPVQVILHQRLVDRPEVMNTCWQSGKNRLVCHD